MNNALDKAWSECSNAHGNDLPARHRIRFEEGFKAGVASCDKLLAFVVDQAKFEDCEANRQVILTGHWGQFDNPDLVQAARALLAMLGYSVCPACKGIGGFAEHDHTGAITGIMCDTCDGKGVV